ncbi:HK97-gp10 family putative phage morphogenesis protein [Belliella pelovolcani]|uniref:Phage protein, HK97 gp10 family n=1 Tax=Belliella pelovolcani TaxID=529505 RepID=A0A1N7MRX3_9BACT|nr:HK97-gp10 family putative phage morphogenesis protein [Belliella pelovolcani]SIS88589.1 phage protein, HK97 gp10 family [Belliella pelovolcani]
MKFKFDLDAQKLLKKLRKLPEDTQNKVIKKAVRKGANEVKKEARKEAPRDTGYMKKSITVRNARKSSRLGQFIMIVNVKSPAHHLIELGTNDRVPTKKTKLKFESSGGKIIYVKSVKGVKANPFLGRAYQNTSSKVMKTFQDELKNFLNKV